MIKHVGLYFLLMIYSPGIASPPGAKNDFYLGEQLTYRMEYLKLPAGEFNFHITAIEQIDLVDFYHLKVKAKTNTLFSPLFGVNNTYESLFNAQNYLPRFIKKEIDQKNIKQQVTIHFDLQNKMAFIADSAQWTIPDSCYSFFSLFYFLRSRNFVENDTLRFNLDSENLPSRGKAFLMRRKTISVPAGKFDAIEVKLNFNRLTKEDRPWRTDLLTNRMANPDAEIIFWFSNDKKHLPLLITFRHKGSSVKLVLKNYISPKTNQGTESF